jgi:hypothetical protein
MPRIVAVGVIWVLAAEVAVGQSTTRTPARIEQLPPMSVSAVPVAVPAEQLPNGMAVSQPLQPVVEPVPDLPQPDPARAGRRTRSALDPSDGPLDNTWYSAEYLLWWRKPEKLPPLATGNQFAYPALNHPTTQVLLGGRTPDAPSTGGGRFVLGRSFGPTNSVGMEIGYFFLSTHSVAEETGGGGNELGSAIGRPFFNPRTGREEVILVASQAMLGRLDVTETARVQGWEVTGLANLYHSEPLKLHALVGYRYFMLNEGVRIEQRGLYNAPQSNSTATALTRTMSADQFDAHNRFHGAELGLRTEWNRGGFFAQLDTRVSLGRAVQVVRISGQTVTVADSTSGPVVSYFPNGVLGQPSNTGRVERNQFAVLPEAGVRVGYQYGERSRFFVGYNFLYLNRAVRAADQIDRVVDVSQSANTIPGAGVRPEVLFDRSDFWTQGITFGLEWRY